MRQFLEIESTSKFIRRAFYSTLQVLFVLKTFRTLFLLFWSCRIHLGLIWNKTKVNSKICDITNWKVIITIYIHIYSYILCNISIGIGNQTIKFGYLVNYNMRIIFLWKKSYMKCGRDASSTPFMRSKLSIYLDQQSRAFYTVLFYFIPVENILKRRQLNSYRK